MTLISFSFFLFLTISVLLYYVSGQKLQKYVLLLSSIFFYLQVTTIDTVKVIAVLTYIISVTYLGALWIERCEGKLKTLATFLSVSALVSVLFVLKYAYNLISMITALLRPDTDVTWLQFASMMGISYFVLSAVGYLMDVYWNLYKADKNIATVSLFVLYFPQLISGPITRFSKMKEQFSTHHRADCDNFSYGMRRMAWGYFKKLIVSERFAMVVSASYGNYSELGGFWLFVAALCYAIRLYTDFSGCMDIVLGASCLFGIRLPENFNAPFLSKTVQEFWQRWHITLGGWFKDYVMYPVQISRPLVSLGKKCKKRFGKKNGKKIPTYLSLFILWFLLGVWHGCTSQYMIGSAMLPCIFLIGSDLLQPLFRAVTTGLKIQTSSCAFRQFQRLRTFFLQVLTWVFISTASTGEAFRVLKHMVTHLFCPGTQQISLAFYQLSPTDLILMVIGVLALVAEHYCVSKDTSLTEVLDKQHFLLRGAIIYAEVLMLLFFGMLGNSTFIYFNF